MDFDTLLRFVVGLVLLVLGAELLVRGASRLAASLGISPLVIGLTVVAYGTSAPELAVSLRSALAGQADIALGNVVGSNIFNVLFVLGGSALITPLVVQARLIRLDVPLMIAASAALYVMGMDGRIGPGEGVLFVATALAYTGFAVLQSRREGAAVRDEYARTFGGGKASLVRHLLLVGAGLVLLVQGARALVDAAVAFARAMGVSELVVGLTIVAAGTSLPEVAASFVAAARGERDIAVGNAVGSNLFNILWVLGLAAAISPSGVAVSEPALRFDIPVMGAVALACLPVFLSGHKIARWEGALFLGYYAAYTLYLALAAQHHALLPYLSAAMLWFALPLTVLTLAVVLYRQVAGPAPQAPRREG
jgi:cation:H+ antiporter